ncbi:MAG: hypothetical protein ACOZAN_04120 [Patescibacteria group bacterium]
MKQSKRNYYQHSGNNFSFNGKKTGKGWYFEFMVDARFVNTRQFPNTINIIKLMVPGVLDTECFNEAGETFEDEVCHTEIGHLFEHILLHLLTKKQVEQGLDSVVYEGNTSWNWKKNPRGNFSIRIWGPKVEEQIFTNLVLEAARVIDKIICSPVVGEPTKLDG